MDIINELLNDTELGSLEEDLAAVRLNDLHFTDAEKQAAKLRMEQRMTAYDRTLRWRHIGMAAVLLAGILTIGTLGWRAVSHQETGGLAQAERIVPRNLDMVLTTTDGHALTLSEGGELVCSELGYVTIKGAGQTLTCKPSANNAKQTTRDNGLCELRVPEGKRTQIELSDGSRLWVNSATTVSFPIKFEGTERCIAVDGEVYLEVAHRQDCPFRVEAGGLKVEVLGTKFGVTAYAGQTQASVVLAEGRVDVVVGDSARYQLQPGQLLTTDKGDGLSRVDDVEAYTYTSWKDGLLYFNGTPLGQALDWLAKQYAVDINCSPNSAHLKLYGKLILEEHMEAVLDNLTVIEPIVYKVRNNQVFVDEK